MPTTSGCETMAAMNAIDGVNHSDSRDRKWYDVMLLVANDMDDSLPMPKIRLSWAVSENEFFFVVESVVV